MSSTIDWQALDYIVNGHFSPINDIQQELDQLCSRMQAKTAVLLVSYRETFFDSLLLVSHEDPAQATFIRSQLDHRSKWKEGPPDLSLCDSLASPGELVKQLDQIGLSSCLPDLFESSSTVVPLCWKQKFQDRASKLNYYIRVAILLVNPSQEIIAETDTLQQLNALLCMLSACPPVVVTRETDVLDQVNQVIDQKIAEAEHDKQGRAKLRAIFDALLKAACELTGSSVGTIYMASDDQRQLERKAGQGDSHPIEYMKMEDKASICTWVYNNQTPLLIDDIAAFDRTHPDIKFRSVITPEEGEIVAELCVPIRQRNFGSKDYVVFGVINVDKVKEKDGPNGYTAHDFTILKYIAMRFCIWYANWVYVESCSSLTERMERNVSWFDNATALPEDIGNVPVDSDIPPDYLSALKDVDSAIEKLYALTLSFSVAVRLLTPDTTRLSTFVAAFNKNQNTLGDYTPIPLEKQDSITAWVARTGTLCYIPNLKDSEAFRNPAGPSGYLEIPGRSDALCELCLPLKLHGRIVGTLNLVSAFQNAYSETKSFVNAMRVQIEQSLANSQRAIMEPLSLNSLENRHRLEERLMEIKDLAPQVGGETQTQLERICKEIAGLMILPEANPVDRQLSDGSADSGEEIGDIIHEVKRRTGFGSEMILMSDPPKHLRIPSQHVYALRVAMLNLINNAVNYGATSVISPASITFDERFFGGRHYLRMKIQSNASNLSPETKKELYRKPFSSYRKWHLGAYQAGCLLRRIGGDVYLQDSNPEYHVTIIEIMCQKTIETQEETTI